MLDDVRFTQTCKLRFAQREKFHQRRICIFAQQRRRGMGSWRRFAHAERIGGESERRAIGAGDLFHGVARDNLWVGINLIERVDWPARHLRGFERRHPLRRTFALHDGVERGCEVDAIVHARFVVREFWIIAELYTCRLAEIAKLTVIADREDDVAVRCPCARKDDIRRMDAGTVSVSLSMGKMKSHPVVSAGRRK